MKKITISALLFLTLTNLYSEELKTINLEKAVSLAKLTNLNLKRETLSLAEKRKEKDSFYNVFYPYLSGNSSISRDNSEPNNTSLSFGYNISYDISLDKFDNIKVLKKEYEIGEIDYRQAVKQLEMEVESLFNYLLFLRDKVNLYNDILAVKIHRLENIKNRPELDVIKLRIDHDEFKNDFNNLSNSYKTNKTRFKSLLGLDLSSQIELEGHILVEETNLEIDEYYNMALMKNSRLKEIYKRLDLYRIRKSKEFKDAFIPELSINFYNSVRKSDIFENGNFSEPSGALTFSMYYDFAKLLPNSRSRLYLESLDRDIKSLELYKESLTEDILLDITNNITDMNNSLMILSELDSTVELVKKTLKQVDSDYLSGRGSFLELVDSEDTYRRVNLELLEEKYRYNNRLMQLIYLTSK